jgi:hypothetical protein
MHVTGDQIRHSMSPWRRRAMECRLIHRRGVRCRPASPYAYGRPVTGKEVRDQKQRSEFIARPSRGRSRSVAPPSTTGQADDLP